MTGEIAIRASNISKEFLITRRSNTLKEMIVRPKFSTRGDTPFKALDDVSFELPAGRSLGIMGHNGSGKSTLLKLISGISFQTSGNLEVNGQVAALLELGAAFQDEFTGMENIFLQCSIFGMKREEIISRLDDIIEFSELQRFIHTPVKKYSSGMFMRLAFAIALNLDTRILVLDEILAVGDQAFQSKCQERINNAKESGRTILFVSHMIEQVETLADDVLWLQQGRVVEYGPAEELLPKYHQKTMSGDFSSNPLEGKMRAQNAVPSGRYQSSEARITSVRITNRDGVEGGFILPEEMVTISIDVEVTEEVPGLRLLFSLGTVDSIRASNSDSGGIVQPATPGKYRLEARVNSFGLKPGIYLLTLLLSHPDDITIAYDYQLRMHAISIHGDRTSIGTGRVLPLGRFSVPSLPVQ
ncbi:MAG: ABC transporter ATP-binding protein [Candidatus Sumerlaeia bacterium]|nr:ABC transporter ATP-binding protein [Candidatus Sumerlaeia bacterium]